MATQMDIDYALMAGHAYRTTRDEINWIPAPAGWTPFFPVPDDSTAVIFPVGNTGFEAISFKRGSEIVISFSGTAPSDYMDRSSMSKTACARSMRLAGHKWLGRRMECASGVFTLAQNNTKTDPAQPEADTLYANGQVNVSQANDNRSAIKSIAACAHSMNPRDQFSSQNRTYSTTTHQGAHHA